MYRFTANELIERLDRRFPHYTGVVGAPLSGSKMCIGGAYLRARQSMAQRFSDYILGNTTTGWPGATQIADALREDNHELNEKAAYDAAEHIIRFNDRRRYQLARKLLHYALMWSCGSPSFTRLYDMLDTDDPYGPLATQQEPTAAESDTSEVVRNHEGKMCVG